MKWLQENLPVILLVIGLFIGYAELRLPVMVEQEMNERGLVETGTVAAMQDDMDKLEETHAEDTAEWKRRVELWLDSGRLTGVNKKTPATGTTRRGFYYQQWLGRSS